MQLKTILNQLTEFRVFIFTKVVKTDSNRVTIPFAKSNLTYELKSLRLPILVLSTPYITPSVAFNLAHIARCAGNILTCHHYRKSLITDIEGGGRV